MTGFVAGKEGKELDNLHVRAVDLGQAQPVGPDSRPVHHSMRATPRQGIAVKDRLGDRNKVVHDRLLTSYCFF